MQWDATATLHPEKVWVSDSPGFGGDFFPLSAERTTMSAVPNPSHPLDDALTRFVAAVNDFLTINPHAEIEPPAQLTRSGNAFLDIQQGWEELKRQLGRIHHVLVGAEPEVDERLQAIVMTGAEVIELTDDPFIIRPVEEIIRLVGEHRGDIGSIVTRFGNATSFWNVLALAGELFGLSPQMSARVQEIRAQLDRLTAYYILQMPPQEPGA